MKTTSFIALVAYCTLLGVKYAGRSKSFQFSVLKIICLFREKYWCVNTVVTQTQQYKNISIMQIK